MQCVRDGRNQTLERARLEVSETPFGGVGLREPLIGGAALPARRVPRGLLDGGQFAPRKALSSA